MNAMLTIEVRLLSQQAIAQARALQGQLNSVKGSLTSTTGGATNLNQAFAFSNLEKFGKNLQWTGRQLEFNFTLPLLLAGGAATKFALDNETAFTTVRKAYGAFDGDAQTVKAELDALRTSFELLSNRFGIQQKEVLTIAADWAQAGAAGVGLANAVRLTMETMILGQEDAKTATTDLLTIQSAYRLNTVQLTEDLKTLNAIQVTTAIDFGGLVDAVSRSAGIARDAGIDVRHLAAMIAALVPATGSAAAGGNALRTIISRIMAPTKQAADEMALFGINIASASWQALDGTQRLEALAAAYVNLSDAQKVQVASIVGSRWQVNRLDILLNDLNSTTGVYAKALAVSGDAAKANTVYAQQLATVLSSMPQGFKILTTNIQNALSQAILPLLPALTALLGNVVSLVTGFTNLDPNIQQLILSFLVLLAAVGPVTRYIGSFTVLFSLLGKMIGFATLMTFGMSTAELELLTSAELANVGLLHQYGALGLLWVGLRQVFTLFGLLPLIWSGLTSVVDLALSALGKTLAYLSGPFLAAVVDAGVWLARVLPMAASAAAAGISKAFSVIAALPGFISSAWFTVMGVLDAGFAILGSMWEGLILFMEEAWAAMQTFIAGFPAFMRSVWFTVIGITDIALASMEGLISGFSVFIATIPEMIGAAFASPWLLVGAAVVAFIIIFRDQIGEAINWVIDAFNRLPTSVVNAFRQLVEIVKNVALKVRDWLSHINPFAKHSPSLVDQVKAGTSQIGQHYQNLSGVPATIQSAADAHQNFKAATSDLAGDKIATKAANIIQAQPGSADAVNAMVKAMDDLQGAVDQVNQELTKQQALVDDMQRQVDQDMKPFNDAIFANEIAQKKLRLEILKLGDAGQTLDDMKAKMAALAGEIENARGQQADLRSAGAGSDVLAQYDAEVAALQAQSDALQGQVAPAQALQNELDALRITGEQLQLQKDIQFDPQIKALDEQKAKLQELQSAYSDINGQLNDMKSSFDAMASSAKSAISTSLNADQFAAGAGANFADVGGTTVPGLGKEGDLADIQKFNDELQKQLDDALAGMGGFDMFAPLKDMWNSTWGWIKDNVGPIVKPITDSISNSFSGIGLDWSWDGVQTALGNLDKIISESPLSGAWANLKDAWQNIQDTVMRVFDAWLPPLKEIGGWFADAGRSIGDELSKWVELAAPAIEAFTHIYNVVSWVMKEVALIISFVLASVIIPLWTVIWPILLNVIKPIFDGIVGVIRGALEILRGIIGTVLNIINGDWGKAWDSIKTILAGVWDTMYAIVATPLGIIVGLITGAIDGIVGVFQWLYDTLLGHSIIPDLVNGILGFFQLLVDGVMTIWNLIWTGVETVWNTVGVPIFQAIQLALDGAKIVFDTFKQGVETIWGLLWDGIKLTWDTVGGVVFAIITTVIDGLKTDFDLFKQGVEILWGLLWDGIKTTWDAVGAVVFATITTVIDGLKTDFDLFKQGVEILWGLLWDGMKITWDTTGAILFGVIGLAVDGAKIVFDTLKLGVETVWTDLWLGLQTVWNTIGSPIFDVIKAVIENLKTAFSGAGDFIRGIWDGIIGSIRGAANFFIDAYNAIANAINKVLDFLHLPTIPSNIAHIGTGGSGSGGGSAVLHMARGGVLEAMSAAGGITNQIRAIVGEGSNIYPEYVIPTDPQYRKRALMLMGNLQSTMLMADGGVVPMLGLGDIVGSIPSPIPGISFGDLMDTASGPFKDVWALLNHAMDLIGNITGPIHDLGMEMVDRVIGWVKDSAQKFASGAGNTILESTGPGQIMNLLGFNQGGIIPALANGGIVLPTPGGTLVRLGEAGVPESVQPLPSNLGGDTINNFYGNLEFPNITKPEDAGKFLDNLKSVSG